MKGLSAKWQKAIIWLTGYVQIVAFILAGGYLFKNTEHEEVKRSAKIALVVTAIFTALDAICAFLQYCCGLAESAGAWLTQAYYVIQIIKIITFAIMFIVDLTCGFENQNKTPEQTQENNEENK